METTSLSLASAVKDRSVSLREEVQTNEQRNQIGAVASGLATAAFASTSVALLLSSAHVALVASTAMAAVTAFIAFLKLTFSQSTPSASQPLIPPKTIDVTPEKISSSHSILNFIKTHPFKLSAAALALGGAYYGLTRGTTVLPPQPKIVPVAPAPASSPSQKPVPAPAPSPQPIRVVPVVSTAPNASISSQPISQTGADFSNTVPVAAETALSLNSLSAYVPSSIVSAFGAGALSQYLASRLVTSMQPRLALVAQNREQALLVPGAQPLTLIGRIRNLFIDCLLRRLVTVQPGVPAPLGAPAAPHVPPAPPAPGAPAAPPAPGGAPAGPAAPPAPSVSPAPGFIPPAPPPPPAADVAAAQAAQAKKDADREAFLNGLKKRGDSQLPNSVPKEAAKSGRDAMLEQLKKRLAAIAKEGPKEWQDPRENYQRPEPEDMFGVLRQVAARRAAVEGTQ